MPFIDLNSYEAAPLILIGLVLPLVALIQVWRHVPTALARVVLALLVLALPFAGSLIALVWARRYAVEAPRPA